MAVFVSNITIEQGFDFDTSFQLEDTRTNTPLVLTGAATEGMLRKSYTSASAFPLLPQSLTMLMGLFQYL